MNNIFLLFHSPTHRSLVWILKYRRWSGFNNSWLLRTSREFKPIRNGEIFCSPNDLFFFFVCLLVFFSALASLHRKVLKTSVGEIERRNWFLVTLWARRLTFSSASCSWSEFYFIPVGIERVSCKEWSREVSCRERAKGWHPVNAPMSKIILTQINTTKCVERNFCFF